MEKEKEQLSDKVDKETALSIRHPNQLPQQL